MKKRFLLLTSILLFSLIIGGAATAQDEPTTLRIGTTYMIDTLNPTNGFYGYTVRPLWYDTLVTWGGGDNFEPSLAESWSVSEDGLTWTFNLREGVTFSDGTPLTANEAAWNINWIIENEIPSMIGYMTNVESAEAVDDTTLQINVSAPVPDMISAKLLYVWMLPPSVWADLSADEIAELSGLETTVGSGPYRLTEYQEGEFMVMEANPDYWRGTPPVERIIYQEYATEDALVQALLAGEIDVVLTVPGSGAQPLIDAENIATSVGNDVRLEELIINSSPEGTQPASLNDPVVRLAIAHAIDKVGIANVGYFGYAEPAITVIPSAMGAFQPDVVDVPYDLDEANRILDEAGYVDTDGDGIREYSDGTPLLYRLNAPDSDAFYARVIELIAADLNAIGIGTDVAVMSDESLIDLQIDYDNDLIYWGWALDPDPSFLLNIFTCAETVDGGWSDSGYCNEEYDALFEAQGAAASEEERLEIIHQMAAMLFEDRPYIAVVYPQTISAYRSDAFTFAENLATQPLYWALYNGFAVNG